MPCRGKSKFKDPEAKKKKELSMLEGRKGCQCGWSMMSKEEGKRVACDQEVCGGRSALCDMKHLEMMTITKSSL